jgi:PKD repeat protein
MNLKKIKARNLLEILLGFAALLFLNYDVNAQSVDADFTFNQNCDTVYFFGEAIINPPGWTTIDSLSWDFGDGVIDTITNQLFDPKMHIYSNEGSYTVQLTLWYDNPALTATKSGTVNYYIPTAAFDIFQFCDSINLFNKSTTGGSIDSIYWNITGNGVDETIKDTSPGSFDTTFTFPVTGSFNVLMKVFEGGCWDTISHNVDYFEVTPDFEATYKCDTIDFKNTSTPLADIDSVLWIFGDGNQGLSKLYPFDTTYLYSVSDSATFIAKMITYSIYGCSDTAFDTIYIEHPVAGFVSDTACFGYETSFTDTTWHPVIDVTWDWLFDDGGTSTVQNPQYTFPTPGIHSATLTVENGIGCIDDTTQTVFVDSVPKPEFGFNAVCFGDTTFFTNLTDTLDIFDSLSWEWHFGDPASGLNDTSYLFEPGHVFTDQGSFDVTLFVKNNHGCIDSVTYEVEVDSVPEANFSFQDISVGSVAQFTDLSNNHGYPFKSYLWDFGDGTTSNIMGDVTHTYDTVGKLQVCLTVTQYNSSFGVGCSDIYCDSIEVTTRPLADFDYIFNLTQNNAQFTDKSVPPEGVGLKEWYWNFGDTTTMDDTSTLQNPYYSYPDTGYYNVYLQVTDSNGGVKDTTKQIYIGSAVIAKFMYSDVCFGDSVYFYDESYSPVEANIIKWQWDFGDGTDSTYTDTLEYVSHFYDTTGVYNVSLVITTNYWGDTIRDTTFNTVYVHHLPIAEFDSVNACKGVQMQFFDLSSCIDTLTSWLWDFDDGSTSDNQNPYHLYADTGIYDVKLTTWSQFGCTDTITRKCVVSYAPIVTFQVENNCLNSPARFIPVYDSTFTKITSWEWNFGDPISDTANPNTSTEPNPSHIYSVISNYQVTMTAASYGCPKTVSKSFLVYPIPYSEFDLSENYDGVQGKTIFTNESIYAKSYLWDFGNGNTSTIENPIEVYEEDSLYTVTLISYNEYGCSDTSRHDVEVLFKGLYFPSAFSPNNPNEEIRYFEPKGVNLMEFHVYVYDMKGNKVWESDKLDELGSPTEKWDGYYNGILQPEGTYVWKAYGVFRDGTGWTGSTLQSKEPVTSGTVTLIR